MDHQRLTEIIALPESATRAELRRAMEIAAAEGAPADLRKAAAAARRRRAVVLVGKALTWLVVALIIGCAVVAAAVIIADTTYTAAEFRDKGFSATAEGYISKMDQGD